MQRSPRPRKTMVRQESPGGIRFITFSCHKRLPLLKNPAIARLFLERLSAVREEKNIRLYAYVVMPEHVHLLFEPTVVPADRVLVSLKHPIATRVITRWRKLNAPILKRVTATTGYRFWEKGGGFDRNVRDETEFTKTVRYIHQNPVERGLVDRAEDYEFSSARWWLARHRAELPSTESCVVPCDDPAGNRDWPSWRGFMAWHEGHPE